MKKLFLILASLLLIASCEEYKPTYRADVKGDADGKVAVVFPDGSLDLNGKAELKFHYGNDTTKVVKLSNDASLLEDKNLRATTAYADAYTDKIYATTEAGGTYYLEIDLYFLEPTTGNEVHTHKVLTNR